MKKLLLLISMLAMACCTLPHGISSPPNLPTKSYVKVVKTFFGVKKGSGSGTIISIQPEGGFILTAAHVCVLDNPFEGLQVKDMNGETHEGMIVRVNVHLDMCMVFAPDLKGPEVKISLVPPRPGDEVFSISSPYGIEGVSEGMVPVIRGTYAGKKTVEANLVWDMYHLPIAPGSSGGMIVDRHGHMIGMTHRLLVLGRNYIEYSDLSVGVQYEDLKKFLMPYM